VFFSALLDGPALDLLSAVQDALAASKVDVGGCEVVEALVVAAMIVVFDEVSNGTFEIARQIIVFEQDPALE
jgi:hypothetical protein